MPDGRFKFELLAKYPHMKPGDVAIWERFIKANPDYFTSVDYDVNVGEGAAFDTALNNLEGQSVAALYYKKIDVVGYKDNKITLIEVKPAAGLTALGQINSYYELYIDKFKPASQPEIAVLTDQITPDIQNVAAKWNTLILTA